MLKKYFSKRSVIKIIRINIFLLFFLLIMLFVSSFFLQEDFTNKILENNRDSLKYISKEIESDMMKLSTSFHNINDHQSLLYFRGIESSSYVPSAKELIEYLLWNKNRIDNMVDDFVIYTGNGGYFISSTHITKEPELITDYFLNYEEIIKYSSEYRNTGLVIQTTSTGNKVIGFQSGMEKKIMIFALLKKDYLKNLLGKDNIGGASIIITDSRGEILLTSDNSLNTSSLFNPEEGVFTKIDNIDYICNTRASAIFDLRYVMVYPKKYINQQVFSVNKVLIPTLIIYCIIISIIVYINSAVVRNPLKRILGSINRNSLSLSATCNEFELIDSSIRNLKAVTSELECKIIKFRETNMLNKLLYGKHIDDIQMITNNMNTRYFVLIVASTGSSDSTIDEVDTIISSDASARIINISPNLLTYMMLVFEEENFRTAAERIINRLAPMSDQVVCGLSGEYKGIIHLRQAYTQSMKALTCRRLEGNLKYYYFYQDLEKYFHGNMDTELNITMEEVEMLIHLVVQGETDKLHDILKSIKEPDKSFISFRNTFVCLLESLLALLKKERVEIGSLGMGEADMEKISNVNNIYDFYSVEVLMNKLFISAAMYFRKSTEDFNTTLIRFINENYDKGINMNMLVDEFKKSRSYIAECVKNVTGDNYLDYITRIKMQKARELLLYTDKNLNEIAKELDYMNANYLVKKFKKYFGQTPGQYRSAISEEI